MLEHHSGVVTDSEEEYAAHRRLTERWDEGINLTSAVQFLNALFRGRTPTPQDARAGGLRAGLRRDQALPKACTRLFEEALRFLTEQCGATALILTATQPRLALSSQELIRDVPALFEKLRRVEYRDETRVPRTTTGPRRTSPRSSSSTAPSSRCQHQRMAQTCSTESAPRRTRTSIAPT